MRDDSGVPSSRVVEGMAFARVREFARVGYGDAGSGCGWLLTAVGTAVSSRWLNASVGWLINGRPKGSGLDGRRSCVVSGHECLRACGMALAGFGCLAVVLGPSGLWGGAKALD
jgi:hypothetical protein